MKRRTSFVLLTITAIVAISAMPALAYTAGTLPGGTAIEVDNTVPSDGEVLYIPIGETTIDVTDTGTASVAEGVAVADTTLIYVLDASGSTAEWSGGTICGEQQTHDLYDPIPGSGPDQIIDCEILAAINLNDEAVNLGSIDEVAFIMFAGAAVTADATPAGGDDPIIHPADDANGNATNDANEILQSIMVAYAVTEESGFKLFTDKPNPDIYLTNFSAGIEAALDVAALATSPNVVVVFLSDGLNSTGDHVNTFDYGDVVFHTFAIGPDADCTSDPWGLGSLKDIADLSGGTCTRVEDPTVLPEILPELIGSTLDSLEISVDGGPPMTIDNMYIDPDLPQDGPVTVSYSVTIEDLGVGDHTICVTANGTDVGGSGSVIDCKTVTVVQLVEIDIKPWSDPNSINTKSNGVIAVAILGSETLDVTLIDPSTLDVYFGSVLGVGGAMPTHDINDPEVFEDHIVYPWQPDPVGNPDLWYTANEDDIPDLVIHFKQKDTGFSVGDTIGYLWGFIDGWPFEGSDSVNIVK